jgi:hypothetical protein
MLSSGGASPNADWLGLTVGRGGAAQVLTGVHLRCAAVVGVHLWCAALAATVLVLVRETGQCLVASENSGPCNGCHAIAHAGPLAMGRGTRLAAEKDLIELIVRTDCHHPYPWFFAAIRTLVAIIRTLPLSVPLLPLSVPLLPLSVPLLPLSLPLLRPPQTLRNAAVVWHASLPRRLQQKAFRRALRCART